MPPSRTLGYDPITGLPNDGGAGTGDGSGDPTGTGYVLPNGGTPTIPPTSQGLGPHLMTSSVTPGTPPPDLSKLIPPPGSAAPAGAYDPYNPDNSNQFDPNLDGGFGPAPSGEGTPNGGPLPVSKPLPSPSTNLPTLTPGTGDWNTSMPAPAKLPLTVGGTPQRAGPGAAATGTGTFDGSLGSVQAALKAAGWPATESADYWESRIMQTGGPTPDNLKYWEDRIAAGPASVQPGGQYYEAPGGGGTGGGTSEDALLKLLGTGTSPFGGDIQKILSGILATGGVTPNIGPSLINAREAEATGEQGQLADALAQLSAAGAVSEPGVAQGPETSAIERIQSNVAPAYAQSVRDIETHASDTQNQNLMSALSLATGMSEAEANTIISAVGTGTQRQVALASIALDQLKQSDDWNKFLAQYGLDQAKLQNDINNGNWDHIISLLSVYTQGGGVVSGGGFLSPHQPTA